MKSFLITGLIILAGLVSCEKYNRDVIFAINDIEFMAEDISLYDSSTHILYLKRSHGELEDVETSRIASFGPGSHRGSSGNIRYGDVIHPDGHKQ